MILFDTHAHLDDDQFDVDRDGVVTRARHSGVETIVSVGTTAASSEKTVALANTHSGVYAAVGIQPNYVSESAKGDWDHVVALLNRPRVVAIGETGLDRHWDYSPIDQQQDFFDRHIRLAQQKDKPFIVHMRDCEEDILIMLREARRRGPLRGIMHSFTGTETTARECLDLGMHISFAGMVTYKKSDELRVIAGSIPDDRILIETDAPYLSPHPVRGQRPNEPALLVHTASRLAEVRGADVEDFAKRTSRNAMALFDLELKQ